MVYLQILALLASNPKVQKATLKVVQVFTTIVVDIVKGRVVKDRALVFEDFAGTGKALRLDISLR